MPETHLEKLKKMTAWTSEPTLTEAELNEVLVAAALPDSEGRLPGDVGWVPTYDMNCAACNAWMIKAARAAALTEVDPPGSGIVTSRVFENCRAMARTYSARRAATVELEKY